MRFLNSSWIDLIQLKEKEKKGSEILLPTKDVYQVGSVLRVDRGGPASALWQCCCLRRSSSQRGVFIMEFLFSGYGLSTEKALQAPSNED